MTRVLTMIWRIGALLLFASVSSAQTRDNLATPTTGTASISGVVMSDASPSRPVRRVMVTLGSGGAMKVPLAAITDDNGVFAFANLPAGAYTLVGMRPAWVPTAYGTKTYGRGSGVPISLAAGQQLTGVALKMLHGSVITGTIRDASGRPATDVEMILMTVQAQNGRRKVTPVLQSATVDKRGEYRIYGLAPGDYMLRAQPPPRMGAGELRPTTPAELEWAKMAAVAQGAAAPGVTADVPPPPPNGRPVAFAPTYYPGTPDVAGATVVTLGANEERAGVDFSTTMVPIASISGRVIATDGQPPRNATATLQLAQTSGTSVIDMLMGMVGSAGVRVGADGRLSGSGIMPGRYRLLVRGAPGGGGTGADRGAAGLDLGGAAGAAAAMAGMLAGSVGGATLWASEDLDINGRDIEGLELRLQPGLTMSGTVAFEGEDPKEPVDASRVTIMLNPASREAKSALEMMAGMFSGTMGGATKERTFTVAGITPDTYRATFNPPGANPVFGNSAGTGGWVLKSAMLNGKDLADLPFEIRPGDEIKGVVLTFTKSVTQISGKVQDAGGRPVSGFPIVVFPTERGFWSPGSRRILSAKPASDGTYKVSGLPAGEYYLCALTDLDPNDLYDAAFLDQLVAGSFKITLSEGEKKVQDLRLGGGH